VRIALEFVIESENQEFYKTDFYHLFFFFPNFPEQKFYILKLMYMCFLSQYEFTVLEGFSHSHLVKVSS
jgi:hypothetical protein